MRGCCWAGKRRVCGGGPGIHAQRGAEAGGLASCAGRALLSGAARSSQPHVLPIMPQPQRKRAPAPRPHQLQAVAAGCLWAALMD